MGFKLWGRDLNSQKKISLHELKQITEREKQNENEDRVKDLIKNEIEAAGILEQIEQLSGNLADLNKKINDMNSSLLPLNRMKEDSLRKMKMKRVVLEALKKKKRLTASELASILNLSRTRCSEYLTELERSGLAKGMIVNKQKFFEYVPEKVSE